MSFATLSSYSPRHGATHAQPLPERIAALVHEARWLVIAAVGLYLALILGGYDKADPGWSQAADVDSIANPGGRFGAWLADLLLYVFGLSAWWWVGLLFLMVALGYHRINHIFALHGNDRRPLYIALGGFAIFLIASCGLEAMRFWSLKAALPLAPGGMLGHEIGHVTARHGAQRATRQQTAGLGVLAATILGAVLEIKGVSGATDVASTVSQGVAAGFIASYSRDQESQADKLGAERDVSTTLERGKPEAVIAEVIGQTPGAMLVMGAYGH